MTLRHMKIFLAVCGSGCSVTGAAKELFMSQPSVTIAIREIEEHYGVRLFDRIGRRLYLTPAGEQFRDYAQRILALQEDLDKSMEKNAVAGSMRIGASMTVGSRRMPEYVRRYLETRETLQADSVRVIVAPSRELEEKLLSNELDLALVEIPVHSDALTVTKYMEDTLEIIAPAEYGGAGDGRSWHGGQPGLGVCKYICPDPCGGMRHGVQRDPAAACGAGVQGGDSVPCYRGRTGAAAILLYRASQGQISDTGDAEFYQSRAGDELRSHAPECRRHQLRLPCILSRTASATFVRRS